MKLVGLDVSSKLIDLGNQLCESQKINNLLFEQGNCFSLEKRSNVDGVISLQTLSWLTEYETPLREIMRKINPQWIALTSLFYEGDISCMIQLEEHKEKRKYNYNIYSIPAVKRLCESEGYILTKIEPFIINIDIKKPQDIDYMGTYTKKIFKDDDDGFERLQISGPLLMNWYMLMIEKS